MLEEPSTIRVVTRMLYASIAISCSGWRWLRESAQAQILYSSGWHEKGDRAKAGSFSGGQSRNQLMTLYSKGPTFRLTIHTKAAEPLAAK